MEKKIPKAALTFLAVAHGMMALAFMSTEHDRFAIFYMCMVCAIFAAAREMRP